MYCRQQWQATRKASAHRAGRPLLHSRPSSVSHTDTHTVAQLGICETPGCVSAFFSRCVVADVLIQTLATAFSFPAVSSFGDSSQASTIEATRSPAAAGIANRTLLFLEHRIPMPECSYGSPFYESSGRRKYGCPY